MNIRNLIAATAAISVAAMPGFAAAQQVTRAAAVQSQANGQDEDKTGLYIVGALALGIAAGAIIIIADDDDSAPTSP